MIKCCFTLKWINILLIILKKRNAFCRITLLPLAGTVFSQSYGFSSGRVWMWELDYKESWVLKNWCFWTVVLEKTLESPLDCKKSNQSILKEISPAYSLEGLILKLKLNTLATWCEELTHLKRPWCWERLKAGGEGDNRGWDGWMASRTQRTWVSDGQGGLVCCSPWGLKESDTTKRMNWIELVIISLLEI